MRKHSVKLLSIAAIVLSFGTVEANRWSRTGDLNVGRSGQMGVVLPDGRVMMIGGLNDAGGCETFDPATGVWTREDINPYYSAHTMAILLYNGKVLYLPGPADSARLYDPRTDNWTTSGANLPFSLPKCCATLLKDGRVLVMYNGQNCMLYDWQSDAASGTGSASYSHSYGIEILLPNGDVLLSGGFLDPEKCEIYNPGSGSWSTTDDLNTGRNSHAGVLLRPPYQDVLVAGTMMNATCELYNISSGSWSYTDDMILGRSIGAMALLPSGQVLMMGGASPIYRMTSELYDPGSETWTLADSMEIKRHHFTAAILPTGKVLVAGCYTSCPVETEIYDPSNGVWIPRQSLNTARAAHTVTPLAIQHTTNCSTNVLVTGGENSTGILKSCELYNYKDNTVSLTGELNEGRTHHATVLLPSDLVLTVGGYNGPSSALSSSELFNSATESWTPSGPLSEARFDHTATLLGDGRVLVTGGEDVSGNYLTSCEVYSTGIWGPTGPMGTPRKAHSTVILLNGNVMAIGGETTGGAPTVSCEIWNGTTWTPTGDLATSRRWHSTVLLQSGHVLAIGGQDSGGGPLTSCEIYNPVTGAWSPEGSLNHARFLHNSTILYSGLVLVTGGNGGSTSCEMYDPATHEWTVTAALGNGREYHSSALVPIDKPYILAIGGKSGGTWLSSIEWYDVGLGYLSSWQSTITNRQAITKITTSMHLQGTLFRDVSEADGGNYCHIASNDHPIISLVRIGGGNFQGNGGGDILHMPLSSSWDASHTIVHPDVHPIQGHYRLWSIVNGIPCKWYETCAEVEEESSQSTVHGLQSTVFPNPATSGSGVHFRFGLSTMDHGPSTLTIYDLTGRLTRSVPVSAIGGQITVNELAPGIYFYRVEPVILTLERSEGEGSLPVTGKFTVVE